MKIKKILVALLLVFTAFALVGCVSQKDVDIETEKLEVALGDLAALEVVKAELAATLSELEGEFALLEQEKLLVEVQLGEAIADKGDLLKQLGEAGDDIEDLEAAIVAKDLEIGVLEGQKLALEGDLQAANATIQLLNAQKVELEKRPIAPTAIELFINSLVLVGDTSAIPDPDFDLEFTPANAYKGLYYESSNVEIVTVNQLGQITGVKPGKATITAKSVLNTEVSSSIEVEVKEQGQNLEIVQRAVAEVLALVKLGKLDYAAGNVQFPHPTNTSVKIKFEKENGSEIVNGLYLYTKPAADAKETITVRADYGDASYNDTFTLKVVIDMESNVFKKTEFAQTYVEFLLLPAMKEKLYASIALPTTYLGVAIVWSTDAKLVVSAAGEYVRPLDDTPVKLTAAYTLGASAGSLSYSFVANGYNPEEKMAYILGEGTLLAFAGFATNAQITFPSYDDKFNANLTYVSKDHALFTDAGAYVNQELAEDTPVVFEVTFEYKGQVLGTKEITIIAKAATDTSRAAADFLASADVALIPSWFPYGGENGIQIKGLPVVVGETGVAIEWSGNAEDFDETLTLKTQYLRYHESILTAKFSKEGVEDTELTFVVNTGISQDKNALLVGGRFSEQQDTAAFTKFDLINTFSHFDKMVGTTVYPGQNYWSWYSGYTYYINGSFAEDGVAYVQDAEDVRHQYFAMDSMTAYITDVDSNGYAIFNVANLREGTGGNWGIFFVNLTDKVAKIKLASYSAGAPGPDGVAHGAGQGAREGDKTFDGFRVGWTADAEGNIVIGSGKGTIQARINSSDPSVPIPANGYGMTYKTQQNNADVVGHFANEGTKLTIEHYSLHPMNDYRNVRFVAALNSAEAGIVALEAGEATEVNVATQLKNAQAYMNDARLTDLEKETFDLVKFNNLVARFAAIKDADLLALKGQSAEDDYLTDLLKAYNAYLAYIVPIQEAMTQGTWLLGEYEAKLAVKYSITYDLNGGSVYANTKTEINELFLNDLYQHLTDAGFNSWVTTKNDGVTEVTHTLPSLEEFKNATSTHQDSFFQLMNDSWFNGTGGFDLFNGNANHFARIWLFELWKDNHDAWTIDASGLSKHFIRQPEYNKWMRLLWYINEMLQEGNGNGRDVLGRVGLDYDFTYLHSAKPVKVVTDATATNRTVGKYILGLVVDGAQKTNLFPENYYLFDSVKGQSLVDAAVYQYTAGTETMPQPAFGRDGHEFAGWYLDAEGTLPAVMTPEGLGLKDVTLYAKWFAPIPAPGEEIGSFQIQSFKESIWAGGASAKTSLSDAGTGGTYWYKIILKTTETAGIYEVRQVIGGVAYTFVPATDALSIHYHDDNVNAVAINAIGIVVGDFVIFHGVDVMDLPTGPADFAATVYRAE